MNLTKPQKLIYDMERFAGGSINVICGSMVLTGKKSEEELVNAAQNMLRSNDVLRIRICKCDGELTQDVQDYADTDIEVLHFAGKAELDSYALDYAKQPLDFYGNLCELKVFIYPGHYGIMAKIHHIISDAWTLAMVGSQFNAFLNGVDPDPCSYCEYVETEKEYLQSQRFENDRAFFLEQFKKCDEVTYLSEKHTDGFAANRKTIVIGQDVAQQIRSYATKNKTSAYTLFMTVLAVYINRIKMNTEKFYIGTAVLNRSGAREKRTMGMFVNTVPMLIELNNEKSFAENLTDIGKTIFSAFRHQKYNYGEVLSSIRSEFGFGERLYDVMLSYQNATVTGLSTDMESTWYHSGMQNESLQIHIDDRDNEGVFRIHYDYQTDKFTEQEIEQLHNHLMTLLQDAIINDTKKLYELELLPPEEKQKVLFDFNDTAIDYPRDKCVHQLFEEQVERTPNKIAVIACDKTLTYAELNEQANYIANSLIQKGVVVGDVVAFSLSRKSNMIATMIGILKAGAAYLPIDPNYPQDRIDYILTDSQAKLLVTESFSVGEEHKNPQAQVYSNSNCYCIYTSGSTGLPKGTIIKHKNIVNLLFDNRRYLSNINTVAWLTTITFDVATQEIFLALINGLTGYLFVDKTELTAKRLSEEIIENKIDVLFGTPTYFDLITQNQADMEILLKTLKMVVLAGEQFYLNENVLNAKHLEQVCFLNQYGPAETHVCSSATYRMER